MVDFEMKFHNAMLELCDEALRQCNINFTRLRKMLANENGVDVAKKLVNSSELSDGFISLLEIGRTDHSIEFLVLKDEWRDLFDKDTLDNARKKIT